ncbi:MAG: hypothetical protein FJ285_04720 [Planctomycetes bacterium]|nr:hypothetical protein [Planctomycetota bacterium]
MAPPAVLQSLHFRARVNAWPEVGMMDDAAMRRRAVGHAEWTAICDDDVVRVAAGLAHSVVKRAGLRTSLRSPVAKNALCDQTLCVGRWQIQARDAWRNASVEGGRP